MGGERKALVPSERLLGLLYRLVILSWQQERPGTFCGNDARERI